MVGKMNGRGRAAVVAGVLAVGCLLGLSLDQSVRAQDSTLWWARYGAMNNLCLRGGTLEGLRDQILSNKPDFEKRCASSDKHGEPVVVTSVEGAPGAGALHISAYVGISQDGLPPSWWPDVSCAQADRLANDVLRKIGIASTVRGVSCEYEEAKRYTKVYHKRIDVRIPAASLAAPASATCNKSGLLGPWKNASARYAEKGGAGLTFERSARQGEFLGRFRIGKGAQDAELTFGGAIETSGPAKGCLFPANVGSSQRLEEAIKFDKAADSFTIVDARGAPHPRYPGRWTRGAPAKPTASCGKDAINGTWHRADGTVVKMAGVETFADGGHAIVERFPGDRWPKGRVKFSVVKKTAECRYTARCATVDAKTTNGRYSYDVRESDCTLTVDPVKRTLTASGTHGVYRREAYPQAGEAAKPPAPTKPVAADEVDRAAALNAEVARRDAEIQRRNAAAKAADERRQAEYRAALAAQKAEAERIRRQDAEAKARYEQQMAAWRARVAACNAGDVSKCGP